MFPLTSILRRNESTAIPDRILELLLLSLRILCEDWWWYCDLQTWEQLFMLCSAFIGNMESKGNVKERDDESKEAAIYCLISLTRERGVESAPTSLPQSLPADVILSKFLTHAHSDRFIPILGQTLNALTTSVLELLRILLELFVSNDFMPTVLPGMVSTMSRLALGISASKGWANGDIVSLALSVMQEAVIKSVGDDVCIKEGLVRNITDLDDLIMVAEETGEHEMPAGKVHQVVRTPSWLKATSYQLLMALKILTPIVSHPTAAALIALSSLSSSLLESTSLTLPSCQPLLASFLLSLSQSTFVSVSSHAYNSLIRLTSPGSKVGHPLLQSLLRMTGDILSTLPRLLPSRADSKVEHLAGQVEAICRLVISTPSDGSGNFSTLSKGVGKLFGPMGGIEKWGWRLLTVMEFDLLPVTVMATPVAQLMLEHGVDHYEPTFPELTLKHVAIQSTQTALERMFRALGNAGGEDCIYSVEWLAAVGGSRKDSRGVAALWLGCRLLEGIAGFSADAVRVDVFLRDSKRLDKVTRGLSRSMAELWDVNNPDFELSGALQEDPIDDIPNIEHVRGIVTLDQSLRIGHGPSITPRKTSQPVFHSMVALQVLSVSARVLQGRFATMLLHTLYPVLHSIVSPVSQLSDSGFAALNSIASSMSYASPANLLLSNFDYVLDAVSRRLSRQRLDIDAVKVLLIVIRLVGRDVIQKAADVVEECFDRLDDFHGYNVVVDGLVEVLHEVIRIVESAEDSHVVREEGTGPVITTPPDDTRMDAFERWFASRDDTGGYDKDSTEYGPAPGHSRGESHEEELKSDESQEKTDPGQAQVTPLQALTKQIVSRTIYFLTHESATTRAKILTLLSSAVPVLPESALLTSIHQAWPFILNKLSDTEPFVVTAATGLVEVLSMHVGSFMYRKVWDDVWPRFKTLLQRLEVADSKSALARREPGSVGTESAYTQSHRLHRSMLKTMTAAMENVQVNDASAWEMLAYFRRFLHSQVHKELQTSGKNNADSVWLILSSTTATDCSHTSFLRRAEWDIRKNSNVILQHLQQQTGL
ncbi:ARM repeat-containing protein [Multifurca ochricompacta]|uniref:ARM repeat-containing protein n=1 Tax=Multifurca ochricompacta TaxID=376703 RepID=A0AAD4QU11_9AGAM|nr:ARM repeat-containing protein [Multifurca ochricompacta]